MHLNPCSVRFSLINASEVNFLCVHKKLRSKRLAPVLIKEVTRQCNLKGVFQALYTAGVLIPTPVSSCRYVPPAYQGRDVWLIRPVATGTTTAVSTFPSW